MMDFNFYNALLAIGHSFALIGMVVWIYKLSKVKNGFTVAMIGYVALTAFEKLWSVSLTVGNLILAPNRINAMTPVLAIDYFFRWWRPIGVWGVVIGIIYLSYKTRND